MSSDSGLIEISNPRYVLNLLVEHLYGGDPYLAVRELVQNAHDAIVELPGDVAERLLQVQTGGFCNHRWTERLGERTRSPVYMQSW